MGWWQTDVRFKNETACAVTPGLCGFRRSRTGGDHIRRRRLALELLQSDVAERLGVTESSVWNWESNGSEPEFRYMPGIIEFLGYNPLPEATTLGEQLVRHRTTLGMSQKEFATKLAVDPGTLARWERRGREPTGALLARVTRVLGDGTSKRTGFRRAG
jgi:transcriptional regulator with XRE-family HTH domain